MTDMKQVYQLVDNSIKEGLSESKLKSIIELTPAEEQLGPLFDIPVTSEYILRRFINACMSTDQQIRQHASQGLQNWVERCAISPNLEKLIKYIIDVSNYKKGSNRKSQSDAFATGRVLVVRSLSSFLKNNSQVFQSLNQVLSEFRQIEQQVIEACHLISQDKILKLKFHSLSPRSQSSRFLFKLLLKTKDPKSESVKIQDFDGILETETQNYPKTSTVLYNFGRYLHTVTDNPMQFFRKYANKFLDNDSDKQVDIHEIFSILTVLKGFLKYNQITFENSKFYFDKKIISVWLEQFRVLNKKMKSTAKAISIKFENNPELAYQILVDLHEQGVYLDNISNNHPLSQLYQAVDAEKYFTYIYQLCLNSENDIEEENGQKATKSQQKPQKTAKKAEKQKEKMNETDQNKQQEQQENQETFYNELEYLIKLRFKDLPDSAICSSIILLLNRYHKNQKRKQLLYLCINLLNLICKTVKEKKSKGRKLNKKMMLIMNELNLTQLLNLDEEKVNNFKKAMLWTKKNTVKIRKQENYDPSQAEIDFFNFYNCLVFFSLIYPEEIETCVELQLLYKDLLAFYNNKNEQLEGKPQKRVKRQKGQNDGEQAKKPIHVLTDIFISLMTKPPVFLRKSIHNLFKSIVQFLDTTDIGNMLTVITTPDAEFIQEI